MDPTRWMAVTTDLLAQTERQEAFMRALKESEGMPIDPLAFLIFFMALSLVVTVLYWYQRRPSAAGVGREGARGGAGRVKPARKFLRNPKKLTREVAGALDLSPGELRKLEHHAKAAGVQHPLTLLLCPSLVRDVKLVGPGKEKPGASETPRA